MQQNIQRLIWLASFPKSGNTWTRAFLGNYLAPGDTKLTINQLNTFTTVDVRQDFWDAAWGRPYAGQTIETGLKLRANVLRLIAQSKPNLHFAKTHSRIDRISGCDLITPEVTAAAIYIIRNPFDVAVSYARHISASVDEATDKICDPSAVNASPTQIFEMIGRWDHHVLSWETARGLPLFFMRYEDMISDTERTFRALLDYLQIPINDGKLRRAIRNSSFRELQKQERKDGFGERPDQMQQFFVSGQSGNWRRDLSPAQTDRIALCDDLAGCGFRHRPEQEQRGSRRALGSEQHGPCSYRLCVPEASGDGIPGRRIQRRSIASRFGDKLGSVRRCADLDLYPARRRQLPRRFCL